MMMNRGARGWEVPEREVVKEYHEATMEQETTIVMDGKRVLDLVEHDGVWMTPEDARKA